MDIQETRRARLRTWVSSNGTPTKEKSYFSQVLSGTAPIGERAARRLERDYGMGPGFLDEAANGGETGNVPPRSWPFKTISEEKVAGLSPDESARLEGAWTVAALQIGLDVRTPATEISQHSEKDEGSPRVANRRDFVKDAIQQETKNNETTMKAVNERASGATNEGDGSSS